MYKPQFFFTFISINDQQEVQHGLFKEPILVRLKLVVIRHLENRQNVISEQKNHPILMKFDTQRQIWNSMAVTRPNMKISKIQDGGRPPSCKSFLVITQ